MMATLPRVLLAAIIVICTWMAALAQTMIIDDFNSNPEREWQFVADTVMGGISSGQVTFETEDGIAHAHMTGTVRTANNGGFIQFRKKLAGKPPEGITGIRLIARGNDERYFLHLRTSGTMLPWQHYQAGFDVTGVWREIRLPLSQFEPSGGMLRSTPKPASLRSVGVVAFGRDYMADIELREIGFY